jgi:hypothetical protein
MQLPTKWHGKEGTALIVDMTDQHLTNAYKRLRDWKDDLERNSPGQIWTAFYSYTGNYGPSEGEVDDYIDERSDKLHRIERYMQAFEIEMKRRGISADQHPLPWIDKFLAKRGVK